MNDSPVRRKFLAALERLIEQVKEDRSIVAAVLCGSLSHDTVWARSDIDLVLVTVDDKKVEPGSVTLDADGANVHAHLIPRARFRQLVEGTVHNSFMHSFLAKGRLLYSHDETLDDLHRRMQQVGDRDVELQLLRAGTEAVSSLAKARKWLVTRGDLDYTALWILYAATPLAQIEVIGRHLIADREVIPQALALNPLLFNTIYTGLLNTTKTRETVEAALDAADRYVADRAPALFGMLLDFLREADEARSCTEIESHFERQFDLAGATIACEYLADRGLVGKASTSAALTKRSNIAVQELAFFHLEQGAHAAETARADDAKA